MVNGFSFSRQRNFRAITDRDLPAIQIRGLQLIPCDYSVCRPTSGEIHASELPVCTEIVQWLRRRVVAAYRLADARADSADCRFKAGICMNGRDCA